MATPNVIFLTGLPQAAGPYFPINLRTWTYGYNKLLISQDAMPAAFRKESYELPQRPYPRIEQTWAYTDKNVLELLSKDTMTAAFRKEPNLTDLPRIPWRLDQTWTGRYNLNLVGKDLIPARAIMLDAPPSPWRLEPWRLDQTWTGRYNLNLVGKDLMPARAITLDAPPGPWRLDQTWVWRYNLSLIGLPLNSPIYDRPSVPPWYRDWSINLQTTTLRVTASPAPFAQFDWPTPRGQPRQDQTWAWQYNLNLISLDLIPARAIALDATPVPPWYRDWSVNLQTTTLSQMAPFAQFDWPTPRGQPRQDQTWAWQYNLNLIGLDRLPTGAVRYELTPIGYPRKDQTWSWQYNLNLVGQDLIPARAITLDAIPISPWYRDWSQNLITNTLFATPAAPFAQFDWPLARTYPRQEQTWTWTYNPNLVGRDILPAGAIALGLLAVPSWYRDWSQNLITSTLFATPTAPFAQFDWPLTRAYPRQDQTYTFSAFIPTVVLVAPTPFAQYDWPLPMSPPLQLQQRGFTFGLNQNLPPPVVVTKFEWIVRYRRRRRGTDQITRY
jgi:hypothetical protein